MSRMRVERIVGIITSRTGNHRLVGVPVGTVNREQWDKQMREYMNLRKQRDPSVRYIEV